MTTYSTTTGSVASGTRGDARDVAERWVAALAGDRLDDVVALYAARPVLRVGGDVIVGADDVRRFWASSPLLGATASSELDVGASGVVVRWPAMRQVSGQRGGTGAGTVESRLRIARGRIFEQTVDDLWRLGAATGAGDAPLDVRVAGPVSDADRQYAADKVRAALRTVTGPVLHATMRLEMARDPARTRPARASVNADLDGRAVRAQVDGRTMQEAADLVERRLRDRVEHLGEHREALRRRGTGGPAGEWRHGDPPTVRAATFPRPASEREVVRRKTLSTPDASIDEAIFDMEALDHDVHLFVEPWTGQDAVVWRADDGRYGLRFLHGPDGPVTGIAAAIDVDGHRAPRLTEDEARERLQSAHEPWVFYEDAADGRGHLVYRRRDGHDGVVVPADEVA